MPRRSDPACLTDPGPQRPPDPLATALRASYPDPARIQPVPAGSVFDLVSVIMPIGLDALDLMLRAGGPVGPVAADARARVDRVGFLLPPGTLGAERGFSWWCRGHGMRTASHGDVVALPPLVGEDGRMVWLVAPEAPDTGRTDCGLLLSALRRALNSRRRRAACQETGP
jgi:hypothetical protein